MHLEETTHEHARSAEVYTYEVDYEVNDSRVQWTAEARQGADVRIELAGSIPMGSATAASLAEQAVRDAVIAEIDRFEPKSLAAAGGAGATGQATASPRTPAG